MQDFRSLNVWHKSHALVLAIYRSTSTFPRDELFGLTSQLRRSASSVPANIAEGCGRGGGDFGRFLGIAAGSASESEYHILLARDLGYLTTEQSDSLTADVHEVKRMLTALIQRTKAKKTDD